MFSDPSSSILPSIDAVHRQQEKKKKRNLRGAVFACLKLAATSEEICDGFELEFLCVSVDGLLQRLWFEQWILLLLVVWFKKGQRNVADL